MTATMDYETFLASKRLAVPSVGFDVDLKDLHPRMFRFQADTCRWALKKGRLLLELVELDIMDTAQSIADMQSTLIKSAETTISEVTQQEIQKGV